MRAFLTPVLLLLALLFPLQATAQTQTPNPDIYDSSAPYALLIDIKSDRIFYEKDADVPIPPASMSKLMTQAVIFDMLKSGELSEDTVFPVTRDFVKRVAAFGEKSATMFLKNKDQPTVMDLLRGSIILSANDATLLLAEGIDKREKSFVNRMISKAEQLDLKNSSFANATGFDDPGQRMSVRDLAKLAKYIITEHPKYFRLYSEREFTWNKAKQENRNPLLKDYPGVDGMKTGSTDESGFGLVATAQREGRRLLMVVAGLRTADDRKAESEKMLDWGLAKFRTVRIYSTGDKVGEARVWGGERDFVELVTRDSFQVTLTPAERATAEIKLTYKGPLIAPVVAGTVIGTVRVMVEGRTIAELPVMTSTSVEKVSSMWEKAWDSAKIMMFGG